MSEREPSIDLDLSPLIAAKKNVGSIKGLVGRWLLLRHIRLVKIGADQERLCAAVIEFQGWMQVNGI